MIEEGLAISCNKQNTRRSFTRYSEKGYNIIKILFPSKVCHTAGRFFMIRMLLKPIPSKKGA